MYVHPCAKCQYIPLRRPLIASVGLSMSAARPTLVAFFISSISSIRLLYLQCQSTCRWPWDCALTFLAVFYLFRFSSTWRTCLTTLSTLDLFGDATGEEGISAEYALSILKHGWKGGLICSDPRQLRREDTMAHCFACACVSWMQEETYPRKGRRCLHLFTEFTMYIYHLSAVVSMQDWTVTL